MIYPTTLDPEELEQVIDRVTALSGKELGAARICRLLAESHSVLTSKVNQDCAVGNISDVVSNAINPRIVDLGLYISCMKPPKPIPNRFNQPSGMHLWSFYRDTVANDPAYSKESLSDALRRDLRALQAEFPLDYPPSLNESADAWESALELSEFQAQISMVDGLESASDPVSDFGGEGFSEQYAKGASDPVSDFGALPHVDFGELPHVDFGELPHVDFGELPQVNFDLNIEAANFGQLDDKVNHHAGN